MKKKLIKILLFIIFIIPINVKAAPTGNLSCSGGSVQVGGTIKVTAYGSSSEAMWDTTMSYDSSKLQKIGGSDVHVVGTDFITSISYTYEFKALTEGSAYVRINSAIADYTGEKDFPSTSCTINVTSQSSSSSNKTTKQNISNPDKSDLSEDNSLKSLSIDGVTLSPEFNSDKLEYEGVLLSDEVTEIVINAEVNDEKSSIRNIGTKEVDLGLNKFEIEVEAENGSIRTYLINLTVNEKEPTKITLNGKKYTLMRKLNGVDIPSDFEKTTIKIDNKEVEAFKSIKYKYFLVGLIDKDNNVYLFMYNKGKYTKFNNFKSNGLNIVILDENYSKIPYKYKKINFIINNELVTGYALESNSDFRVVYALNLDTNEKGLYLYDIKENTFQRFYNTQVEIYLDLIKKCKIAFIVAGGVILILFFITICQKITNKKIKKKINNYNINEDLEAQLKKEKPKKEKKKKEKTFIDE